MNEPVLATTASSLAGYHVKKELGMVRGMAVRVRALFGERVRALFGEMRATIQALTGGDLKVYTNLCDRARMEAFEQMLEQVRERGGNAVIAYRFDTSIVMPDVTEVFCYGTAVLVEAKPPKVG